METTDAFVGFECFDCASRFDAEGAIHRCPDCAGALDPVYDYDVVDLDRDALTSRPSDSLWRYADLLPVSRDAAVTMAEGATPLVECPALAGELGVGRVVLKDEGRNPTGSVADRGLAVAVTAARQDGADAVALPAAGDAGQSAAAYAGRAGLPAHVYLPARAGFTTKAMVNVHGGDLSVVGGRFDDAAAAYAQALAERDDWYPLSTFDTPYRHEGEKTAYYEIVEQLGWTTPDAIVHPTGDGAGLLAAQKAARECRDLGLTADVPALYAAQASGCAPIAEAFAAGRDDHEPIDHPDTICGEIEIPDPDASPHVLAAIDDTDGGAVATSDEAILDAAVTVAGTEGLELSPTAAAAASGAWKLAEDGAFGPDDTVVIVATGAGNKRADVLRSHLMSKGV